MSKWPFDTLEQYREFRRQRAGAIVCILLLLGTCVSCALGEWFLAYLCTIVCVWVMLYQLHTLRDAYAREAKFHRVYQRALNTAIDTYFSKKEADNDRS